VNNFVAYSLLATARANGQRTAARDYKVSLLF
jgi:hypothetical protein